MTATINLQVGWFKQTSEWVIKMQEKEKSVHPFDQDESQAVPLSQFSGWLIPFTIVIVC